MMSRGATSGCGVIGVISLVGVRFAVPRSVRWALPLSNPFTLNFNVAHSTPRRITNESTRHSSLMSLLNVSLLPVVWIIVDSIV